MMSKTCWLLSLGELPKVEHIEYSNLSETFFWVFFYEIHA